MANVNRRNSNASDDEMETDAAQKIGFDSDDEGGIRVDEDIYIPPPPKPISELDANGPRLIISKIVNENFKSYAGKQVVGPFHKCFSAIVGPNGSGKSNVIDSMLFVFGYRASKIRSKKISVLIHNSSEHPDIRSCTVSVHFERIIDKPGQEYDIVPNSSFIISRTAFKDSSSFYQLDGKKVQFKEIAKLLRFHGVDLDHNRFLILQGEVEQIAMMKPKGQTNGDTGMLEFLEDIIGTARYKEPLEKLSEKVELLTERRVERLNRLRVVEKEKKDLEEPMQEAVQYLKYENSIIKLEHQIFQCKRLETQQQLETQKEKKLEMDKDMDKLAENMNVICAQKIEKNAEIKEKCKKWDKLQQKKDMITEQYEGIKKKDEALYADIVETNKRRKANMALIKSETAKLEELGRVPEKNAKDIEEYGGQAERFTVEREKEEATLAKLMSGLKEKTAPLLEKRTKLETDLISLRKDVDQAKAAFDIAQSELQLYTSAEHSEKAKLEQLKDTLKSTVETLKERKDQLKSLGVKIPATEKSLTDSQREMDELKRREALATGKLREMRVRVDEQRSAMHASSSRNRVLDALMREKRQGNLPGIFGRLGDLGAIDGKYDVAISTACGPLDNIVVDTVDTAQACISYLRRNDIGRATFIALEKQQRYAMQCRQKIQTPENVPRLFDLIRVEDERVLPAFYYGLHNTLVASDLDQATRIAYGAQRHRVVTLKGELIETSGTMSGGGRTVLRGRMGQSVVRAEPCAADIDKLQTNLDAVYEECNELRAKQPPLEAQIHTLATALNQMKMDRQKYEIEVQSLTQQEPLLRTQLKAQEKKAAQSVSNPEKVQKLSKTVEDTRKKAEKAEESSKSIEDQVNTISQEIEEISGGRVKMQQKKIADLAKKIEKSRAEVCRLQVAIKTAERNAKKTEQHIKTLHNDVEKSEQRLRDGQQEKRDFEETAKNLLAELSEVTGALVERDESSGGLKEELNVLQTRENKMKAVKIELDQKLSELNKAIKELEHRIPDYTRKIQSLKLRNIPGETEEPLKELTVDEINELDSNSIGTQLQRAKERLPEEIPNMQLIIDYQEKDALFIQRVADVEEITTKRNNLRDLCDDARRRRAHEFLGGFSIITRKLKEMYQMITLGGDAELELVDSLDPFSEGIVFSVRPPKKSWKNISNLSGGEKTLSSLALVFALHHYKPSPLYFMDEIDAALDFKNVSIVGNYIKDRTKNAQFIVISLRSNMFELADYLVGIYKTYNCTKCATLNLDKFYSHHGIPHIEPTGQTAGIKNRYGTQSLRPLTQIPPTEPKQNLPPIRSTCPANATTSSSASSAANTIFRLPELGLCPTPKKLPCPRDEAVEVAEAAVQDGEERIINGDVNAETEPMNKKRKL